MASLSLVVSVLDSHEVVRRQLTYLGTLLTSDCELILVDDGSIPPLRDVCTSLSFSYRFTRCPTRDTRPWTEPRARNIGARVASGGWLLFFDIDHILSNEIIATALQFQQDKLHWIRKPAILDENGSLVTDESILRDFGWNGKELGVHSNSFVIRRNAFELLGGYDESFCGHYGGYDIDFNHRYQALVTAGKAKPEAVFGTGYVFPDPTGDRKGLFHRLERV